MRAPNFGSLVRSLYTINATVSLSRPLSVLSRTSLAAGITRLPIHGRVSWMPIPFLGSLFSSTSKQKDAPMSYPYQRTDEEWRKELSSEEYRILRQKGTEMAGTGKYNDPTPYGIFKCAGCKAPLYKTETKFDSGCGWPAFYDAIPGAVGRHVDNSMFMSRTEIVCNNCGGHLGHVFKGEGLPVPTDERHCVNSVSIRFAEEDEPPKVTTSKDAGAKDATSDNTAQDGSTEKL